MRGQLTFLSERTTGVPARMSRTQRIIERLPDFYRTWDEKSLIHSIVAAFGKRLDEAEKDLFALMRSHWVDKAFGLDLDRLGQIYNISRKPGEQDERFRSRLRMAIVEFKGGGTIGAVQTAVRTITGLPLDYPIEILENPTEKTQKEFEVKTGDTWRMSSQSILDATPTIELTVPPGEEKVMNPTITNLDTGESMTVETTLQTGDTLRIQEKRTVLIRQKEEQSVQKTTPLTIPRKRSLWRYSERLEKEIGVFDVAKFDESVFPLRIPFIKLAFTWTARKPATFKLRIPKEAVPSRNTLSLVEDTVNSIKAAGVRAIVEIVED